MVDNNKEYDNNNQTDDNEDSLEDTLEYQKRLRREIARYREQARVAQHDRDVACMTAVQERDEAVAAVRNDAHTRIINAELKAQALQLGIVDLDALKLANIESISIDTNGLVHGVDNAVKLLKEQKPYLFSVTNNKEDNTTTTQILRAPYPISPSAINARSLTREDWQIEREKLLGSSR